MSERKKSRYHVTRTSSTKYLLIADSQARYLDAGNLNIVSLPGASVRHAYDYVPPAGLFDIIILFIGGNDLYNFTEPSLTPARKEVDDIVELANFLCNRAPSVVVLGVPERDENKTRSKAVKDLLQDIAERKPKKACKVEWNYRSVKQKLTGARCFIKKDLLHLNEDGLNNLRNLIKEKVLYKKYSKEFNSRGNLKKYECLTNDCRCICSTW